MKKLIVDNLWKDYEKTYLSLTLEFNNVVIFGVAVDRNSIGIALFGFVVGIY